MLQNADDNAYPAAAVPALEFVLYPDRVEVLNNEKGFGEENVRALCDIGRSTKKQSSGGYIGVYPLLVLLVVMLNPFFTTFYMQLQIYIAALLVSKTFQCIMRRNAVCY